MLSVPGAATQLPPSDPPDGKPDRSATGPRKEDATCNRGSGNKTEAGNSGG
jgi:hypothetical protein